MSLLYSNSPMVFHHLHSKGQSHLSTSRPAWSGSLLLLCPHLLLLLTLLTTLQHHKTCCCFSNSQGLTSVTLYSLFSLPGSFFFQISSWFAFSFPSDLYLSVISSMKSSLTTLSKVHFSTHSLFLLSTYYNLTDSIFYSFVLFINIFCLLLPKYKLFEAWEEGFLCVSLVIYP